MDDRELLERYVTQRCEEAFAEIVRRHVDLVYSAALRMVRDASMAEDVTQTVFVALARRAGSIRSGSSLGGWLYRVTHHQAANAIRADRTRRRHEKEAMMQPREEQQADWEAIAPHLDAAMAGLSRKDQDAVVQRFFQGRSWREIAQGMDLSEDAAQKRVSRALERLRACLVKRGVTTTASALAVAITANAVKAAPAALAPAAIKASLAGAACAGAACAGGSTIWTVLGANTVTKLALTALTLLVLAITAAQLVAQKEQPAQAAGAAAAPAAEGAEGEVALTDGLVLHMTFDQQEQDGQVLDASGQKNHGKVTGARWVAQGHRGGAYEFRADDDRIVIRNNRTLNPTAVTVAAWIKSDVADGQWRRIIDKSWDKGYAMSIAGKWQQYNWSGQVCMETGPGEHFNVTDTKVADGQWHHVVATSDGTEQWIYVDGKPNGKVHVWKEPGDIGATEHDLAIGCNLSNPPGSTDYRQSFRGLIDEPMVWSRALSADEVAALYAAQK